MEARDLLLHRREWRRPVRAAVQHRAGIASHRRHVTNEFTRRADIIARPIRGEPGGRTAQRLLRAIRKCSEEMLEETSRFVHEISFITVIQRELIDDGLAESYGISSLPTFASHRHMKRRDLLRAFGAATALALLPHDALAVWTRVSTGIRPNAGLRDDQLALIGALADTIFPRTDTPSATDVLVPAFVDVVVSENFTDADRDAFVAGLVAVDAQVKRATNASFVDLDVAARGLQIEALEGAANRRAEPARTYWRLKGLIVHGYFTSEPVMKSVLKYEIMPGAFDGNAPMPAEASHG